ADAVERHDLDAWQRFAHDIAAGREAVSAEPSRGSQARRFFLIGTAGTGKSRTVRSFVASKRAVVRRKHQETIDAARLRGVVAAKLRAMDQEMKEDVRFCVQLGAPTGCASFQLKFGASTLHRVFGVPVGYCGPAANRTSERYKIKKKRMQRARLWVLDEMSMVGRRMLGKIEFKVRDHLGSIPAYDGSEVYMGDKDTVLCGDPKQCPPIGDEPLYQEGEYGGKAENKPKTADRVPPGAWSAKKLVRMGMGVRNSCKDVVILRKVHRYTDFDSSLSAEQQALYAEDAVKFLDATRGMADCTWTPSQRDWLARRNRSALQQTEEGRRQLARCDRGPLLMDTKVDRSTGQVGANRVNQMKLEELSARTGKPIVSLGAYHDKPKKDKHLQPEKLDSDDFRGLEANLLMCEEARVLLTENLWPEAGLMNGALGNLKGYMWPAGGDPNSSDSRLRSPLCLLVEFDNLNLKDEQGRERSFFPTEPERKRWVPIFRQKVFSTSEDSVYREQYPLVLAWALTHYKAQGMTLDTARVHLSTKTVGVAGLAFVACTRVRHPWDLVFEEDLPEYEHFMKAKNTAAFRSRRRWELRLQERSSATIRRYGFCEEDIWTKSEADAAESLLRSLRRVAERQRATLRETGNFVDDDAWLWPDGEPVYETLLRDASRELAGQDEEREAFLESVSQRLLDKKRRRQVSARECDMAEELLIVAQDEGLEVDAESVLRSVAGEDDEQTDRYEEVARLVRRRLGQCGTWDGLIEERLPRELGELHMPAMRGALGTLIPHRLHTRLDKAAAREKLPVDSARGGSFLKLDGWRVSVYEEDSLRRGRLDKGMLEFFLKLLARITTEMGLSVIVGSSTLGKVIGVATSLEGFSDVVRRWRECWNPEEAKGRSLLLIPVAVDDVATPRDWVLVSVQASGGHAVKLGDARQLEVCVYDRTARRSLNQRVATFVHALIHGVGSDIVSPVVVQGQLPDCQVSTQRSACVLGMLAGLVQRQAGQTSLDFESATFLPDCFVVFACVFMHLRQEAGGRALSDLSSYVVRDEAKKLLSMFGVVPSMRSSGGGVLGGTLGNVRHDRPSGSEGAAQKLMTAATWNVSGGRRSAQAPESWSSADQAAALEHEVLRWDCDLVALQEVSSPEALESLQPWYNFVGASRSHCGFVQLYLRKKLEFSDVQKDVEGVLACKVLVRSSSEDSGKDMTVAAVHLPSGMSKAPARSRILSRLAQEAEESGVLILGDTNCKDDEALEVCKKSGLHEACYSGCSWGARGNKFDAHCDYQGFGLRYDRLLFAGRVWAETFLVGQRKTFYGGSEFFLSDHHPVLGVVDCHDTFKDSGRAASAMARARRARVVARRDILSREEQVSSFEWLKQGREDKACERQHAADEKRIAAWREQREAVLLRARRGEQRLQAAFGPRSLWQEGRLEDEELPRLSKVCLDGWGEDGWDGEVPTAVFLRGMVAGENDAVMPCLLQVLLRLPAMLSWLKMHAEHCSNSRGCALCW
ncbi:MAG: AAA family ATPase, partial [Planctomycetes bacterium]|nr:AAA family ATPase [Planctomycetota bacterium]